MLNVTTNLVPGEAIVHVRVHDDRHDHNRKLGNTPTHDDCCEVQMVLEGCTDDEEAADEEGYT